MLPGVFYFLIKTYRFESEYLKGSEIIPIINEKTERRYPFR
jgi:hypothetical protein